MRTLVAGECTPADARRDAVLIASEYNSLVDADGKVPFHLQLATRPISQHLMPMVDEVVGKREYDPCFRACFGAILVGPQGLVDGPHWNRVPTHTRSVCRGTSATCIRDVAGKAAANNYSNCPAVHAAVQLLPQYEQADRLIWLEVGAVRNRDGQFVPWVWDNESPDPMKRLYRCSMCLGQSYAKGIHYVGQVVWHPVVDQDVAPAPYVRPHLVLADLLGMMVVETANSKEA